MNSEKNINSRLKRMISVFLTLVLVFNALMSSWLPLIIWDLAAWRANAEEEETLPEYVPENNKNHFAVGNVSMNYITEIVDYCYYYRTDDTFAADHQNDNILLPLTYDSNRDLGDYFVGFGSKDHPFNGTVKFAGGEYQSFTLRRAFFSYVNDNVILYGNNNNNTNIRLNLTRSASVSENASAPLFADHVVHGTGNGSVTWYVEAVSSDNTYSGLIGTIEENALVNVDFINSSTAAMVSNSTSDNPDIGALCGRMKRDSSLTAAYSGTAGVSITSLHGSAGGLVGTVDEGTLSLTINSVPVNYAPTVSASDGYSGGIAGDIDSETTLSLPHSWIVAGTVIGKQGAGGLFGHYLNKNTAESFDISTYFNGTTATATGKYAGGLFGIFENFASETPYTVTFTGNNTSDLHKSGNNSAYDTTGYYGGLIGCYKTGKLTDSLILSNLTMKSEADRQFASYGGVIGTVNAANGAYIQANTVSITAKGTNKRDTSGAFFGGLIGKTDGTHGVFVDLGDFTLNTGNENFRGGGAVGVFPCGVLRLSGTTDLSAAKTYGTANPGNAASVECCYGQLVGENNNVLVYALGNGQNGTAFGSGWTFKRSNGSIADDLGTWGEVVRIDNIEDPSNGVLTLDSANHTVTIKPAVTSMATPADFVKTALNIQLNQGSDYDCLKFTNGSANTRSSLLSATLSLTADISLAGTGINGFMRDGSDSTGAFTGTLNGGSHTVTLAIGELYGKDSNGVDITSASSAVGIGQIFHHPYNALFAVIGNGTTGTGTVNSLTIDGTFNIHNTVDGMNIGGIAAVSKGNTTLNFITANQTVNYHGSDSVTGTEDKGKNIGGLIGIANGSDNGIIAITGTNTISTTFNISGHFASWNALGAFIGKVTSPKFTLNIAQGGGDSLTVSHTMSGTFTAGGNTDGGGLIGYITSVNDPKTYTSRIVNIKNLDFNNCTIINKASNNAGGFLGYAWLDTAVTIDGLTVTNGTITNTTPNVGVMCYTATGRWTVNDLKITKMSLSGADNSLNSLGMLVNKAYNGNNGLYLDVLNAGYTLTDKTISSGITLPNSIDVYDELAAYSAEDVIKGTNAGVISVNMNDDRSSTEARITSTGTYQNKLTTASSSALTSAKYANANSRYYYNLDKMNKSDKAQDIMLWSVNQYAADNIKSEFDSSTSPFDCVSVKDAALSDYSYYPVYTVSTQTLKNINLDFGYSGVYTTVEGMSNTDSYNRDPGEQNQHYLMQSGLFINNKENTTLTLNNVKLSGDFLENGTYQGVLISGTASGNITVNGLVLDGITPKYNNSGTVSNYTSGYLLVRNVTREDAYKTGIQLNLQNISTTNNYTKNGSTEQISKSLFGDVYGPAIGINVSGVKLDARSTNGGMTALYEAYGTVNSIFTTATLFNSIKTSQTATMIYNYSWEDDWSTGRNVTYGKEVSESVEYEDKENKYNNSDKYTDPTNPNHTASPEYDFSTWRPYVAQVYTANQIPDANGCYFRELKVNVPATEYPEGCGTYNDPYIIDSGEKLEAIAALISDAAKTSDLPSLQLPKTLNNGVADNAKGDRWCENKTDHAVYTYDSSIQKYKSTEPGVSAEWSVENVRLYLANAYYSISSSTGEITLSNDYLGLGGTDSTGKFAFRGVIVGNSQKIVNNSQNPLVKVSNGCVVKDISVLVDAGTITLTQSNASYNGAYFGYDSKCAYYGGIIGEIMGGDNIIDNSYVKFTNTKIVLSDNDSSKYGTIIPVGGYVGVIVFGGLIFKNITASKTTIDADTGTGLNVNYKNNTGNNLADNSRQDAWAAIYVNPIVGRVINGYAVNETIKFSIDEDGKYQDEDKTERFSTENGVNSDLIHTLKNGTKHYTIADINKGETNKLSVTPPTSTTVDGTINIPNSQAFFILSLITQSCAGTAQSATGDYITSLSYGTYSSSVYGMSHIASYNNVGSAANSTDPDYLLASKDTAGKTATPYIIYKYTTADGSGNYPARCVTSTSGYYDINLTGKTVNSTSNYTYQLPDSFRGLGSIGNYDIYYPTVKYNNNEGQNISSVFADRANNKFCLKVDVFNGNACIINEDIYLNKYQTDNYLNVLHKGTNQEVNNNTQVYEPNTRKNNHGIGLFDSIIMKDASSKLSGFTLTGSVNTEIYSNTYNTSKSNQIIISIHDNNIWLSVGGVVGWAANGTCLKFEKIDLNNLKISGSSHIGGLLGFSGLSSTVLKIVISECSAEDISVKMTSAKTNESQQKSRNAIGAFVGKAYESAVVIYGTSDGADNSDLSKYSEVKIKAFSFGNPASQYTVASGGLVGFAGHCCQVYDMKVLSSGETAVTIGNSKVSFSGGVVGCMQSVTDNVNETTCIALFKNCIVENLNVSGEYAGGFYGGKWDSAWTPYSITLDNCKVLGKSESEKNTITATYIAYNPCAGGFVGRGLVKTSAAADQSNIRIKDCLVSNYIITAVGNGSDSKKGVAGGFVGYCSSNANNSTITCYIHDSSVEDCIIGASGDYNYGGGAIGWVNPQNVNYSNKMLGYNIKLDNVTSNNNNTMGAWVGFLNSNDNKTSIQFSGMAIYGSGFTKNIGNGKALSTASFVFADYSGKCEGTIPGGETERVYPTDISTYNDINNVDMPSYPYVNINPQSSMGAGEIISGDGAVLLKNITPYTGEYAYLNTSTAKNTVAAMIYSQIGLSGNDRQYYKLYTDSAIKGSNTIAAYMNKTVDADGDRISTFYTERGSSAPMGVDDFAVIVIANTDNEETTNLINRYIQLVTNTTTDYMDYSIYYDIAVTKCVFSGGKFVVSNDTPGLTWTAPVVTNNVQTAKGVFALDGTNADSNSSNTFTLIDVQFKDPFNTDSIAYHLYVPVYTIKQISVRFYSAADSETNSVQYMPNNTVTSAYESIINSNRLIHFDSLNTWITQYIRFNYSQADMNSLINAGNLKWNHDKIVLFRTMTGDSNNRLPENTYMVLVDPNGGSDKAYYLNNTLNNVFDTYVESDQNINDGWIIDLSNFVGFEERTFADMLAPLLTVTAANGDGNYYTSADPNNYDAYSYDADGNKIYYRFARNGNGDTQITLETDYNEDYYLSMYVPLNNDYNNELYFYTITVGDMLDGQKAASVEKVKAFEMFISNLYEQTTDVFTVSPEDQQITTDNREITVNAKTEIEIKNRNAIMFLNDAELYHSFNLSLTRYYSDGDTLKSIIGLDREQGDPEAAITAKYSIGSDATDESDDCARIDLNAEIGYLNIVTSEGSIMGQLLSNQEQTTPQPLIISSKIVLKFDQNKLDEEFPLGTSDSSVGINISATSNLSYDNSPDSLAYSSMSKAFGRDGHYYYRESVDTAHLFYTVTGNLDEYDIDGKNSTNHSRLGINGFGEKSGYPTGKNGMEIKTEATYNVSSITGYESANHIRLTFTLLQKYDEMDSENNITGVKYREVEVKNYLTDSVIFTSGSASGNVTVSSLSNGETTFSVDLPVDECETTGDGIYRISIIFYAKTGEGFTDYANYKVSLNAGLYKTVDNTPASYCNQSSVTDHIIYTNAKVKSDFVKITNLGSGEG